MRVLVSDGSYKHTLGIVRDLGVRGSEVFVCSDVRPAIAGMSRHCRGHFSVPRTDDSAYPSELEKIIRAESIDLYLPVGYRSCLAAAINRERLLTCCRVFVPDEQVVRSAADKSQMTTLAQELSIPVPRSFAPSTLDDALAYGKRADYPLVIKGKTEAAPFATMYADNSKQFELCYRQLVEKHALDSSQLPIIQHRLTGCGFGFFAFYFDGVMQAHFMHRRIREYPVSGGPSTCAESFADTLLLDLGKRLLDRLRWHGVAMVEFKQNRLTGDYCFLEINPKFWGSHDLALHCGVSFPYMMVQITRGERLHTTPKYQTGTRFHWPLSGDFKGSLWRPRRFFAVLCDCLNPRVASNIRLSDLEPNLAEMVQTYLPRSLKQVLKRRRT